MEYEMINGIIFYMETFQEISMEVGRLVSLDKPPRILEECVGNQGRCGLYELVTAWTNEFEAMNTFRRWDGEFFDELDSFIQNKIK